MKKKRRRKTESAPLHKKFQTIMPTTSTDEKNEIEKLVATDRFNVDNLKRLEAFVATQCKEGLYSQECNMTVLKLYQFNPDKADKSVVAQCLTKALMQLPDNHFQLCLFLLPESYYSEEPFSTLILLASLLETAQFKEFWKQRETKAATAVLDKVVNIDDAFRNFIADVLSLTFTSIKRAQLGALLNLPESGDALLAFAKGKNWTCEGDTVTIRDAQESGAADSARSTEALKVEQLSKVLANLQ